MELSIIIVNWNTRDYLQRCLDGLYADIGDVSHEIILVDNASTDGSAEMVRQRYPQVRLVQNESNMGFARANNQAIALAQGRYMLLLNSDAFLHPGALQAMLKTMDAHPEAGGAGCKLFYEDGSLQRSAFAFSTLATELYWALWLDRLFPGSPAFGRYRMSYWDMDDLRQVDWVMGAVFMVRSEAMRQVCGLDEQFFMYSEEVDLCYRLKQAGWKILFIPGASATHIWGGSSRKVRLESFLRLYQARVLFFRKHYGRLTTWLYKLVLVASSLSRAAGGEAASLVMRRPEIKTSAHNYWSLARSVWNF